MKLQFNWKSENIRYGYYDVYLNRVFIKFYNSNNFPYVGDKNITKFCDTELLVYFKTLSLINGEEYIKFPLYSKYIMEEDQYVVTFDPILHDVYEE